MKHYPTYGQSVLLCLTWILLTVISSLIVVPVLGEANALGWIIMYTVPMGLTVITGLYLRRDWRFKLKSLPIDISILSIVLILCLPVLLDPLAELIPLSKVLEKIFDNANRQPLAFGFMAVVAAPVLEECLFRGIILEGFLQNYKPVTAIVISSLAFGIIHGNLLQGINAFVTGAVFGWIYWKTNSLLPCILLHFVNNLVATISAWLTPPEEISKSLRQLIANNAIYTPLYISCCLIVITCAVLLNKKLRPQYADRPI